VGRAQDSSRADHAADRVAQQLALVLLEADLPPGTLLPPEQELLELAGCSRTALRGALRQLELWGLITVRTGRNGGPVMRQPRAGDLTRALAVLVHSKGASLTELMLASAAMHPVIAAEAARRRTKADIADLGVIMDAIDEAVASMNPFSERYMGFHRRLAEIAGLVVLGILLEAVGSISQEALHRLIPNDDKHRQRVARWHRKLFEAVEAGNAAAAESTMRGYWRETDRFWREQTPNLVDAPLRPFALITPNH
jgi:DNA-binding FadR family transcriptional regulator